ncbi:MAG: hypothetical protein IJS74_03905, partial [Clostridia bacterium]|nr:hypothetical protein [Clostridia bacterium]
SYYLLKYEEIKNKKGKIIEFKEKARYKLFEILNEKLSKTKLAPNQEMLVVISSFKQIDYEKLSEEEISELLKNEKINMFEKNTCVKIV